MGAEARCTIRFNGRVSAGTALLETDALIFRGTFALAIPYKAMTRVASDGGRLTVTFPQGVATFDLGPKADTWAARILHPKGRIDKLGVKPGARSVVLGVDDAGFLRELAERTREVSTRLRRGSDVIFIGIRRTHDLERLRSLPAYLKPNGAVWVVAPRGSPDVREADVLAAGKPAGLVDVKVVRFSQTHTAHRFVIPVAKRRK